MSRDINVQRLLSIGNEQIRPTTSPVRNLGVTMTNNMTLDAHAANVVRASFIQLKSLSRIKRFLDRTSMERLVHAFITSRVDYCNALLLGAPAYILKKFQCIQNAAARLITGTTKFQHITPILRDLHWLPVKKRVQFKVLLIVFKSIHKLGPSYLSSMCRPRSNQSLRSRNTNTLEVPFTASNLVYDRCFSIAAPRLWNSLPIRLRLIDNIDDFKKSLKTFLFNHEL
jgi:hypothetical protein